MQETVTLLRLFCRFGFLFYLNHGCYCALGFSAVIRHETYSQFYTSALVDISFFSISFAVNPLLLTKLPILANKLNQFAMVNSKLKEFSFIQFFEIEIRLFCYFHFIYNHMQLKIYGIHKLALDFLFMININISMPQLNQIVIKIHTNQTEEKFETCKLYFRSFVFEFLWLIVSILHFHFRVTNSNIQLQN